MAALPYMPLYVADYLADSAHLSAAEHGIYLLLIMNYWQRGKPLPNDDKSLAKIARIQVREWNKYRQNIAEFFVISDGEWRHKRIDIELRKVAEKTEKRRQAGLASARRRGNTCSTNDEQMSNYARARDTDTDTDTDTEFSPSQREEFSSDSEVIHFHTRGRS